MKYIIALLLIGVVMLTACTKTTEPIACTADAKICPDGTAVGRDPNNNCEFFECSNEKPIPVDVGGTIGDGKTYISEDPEECMLIKFMCERGMQPFFDEKGCGCELIKGEKLQAIDCKEPRPEVCTEEYMPVCGQVQVQCITAPCDLVMQTFGNKCEACANSLTISYTEGACENNAAGGTVLAGTQEEQCTNIGGLWSNDNCVRISQEQCTELGGYYSTCPPCESQEEGVDCMIQCSPRCYFGPRAECLRVNGSWTGYDCEGLTPNQCQEIGGTFNECASACRNDPEAEFCTMQCVQVCEFN